MKKLENFSNCLNVLKNADFDLADNNDIYRTGVIGQFNLTIELAWKALQEIKENQKKQRKIGKNKKARVLTRSQDFYKENKGGRYHEQYPCKIIILIYQVISEQIRRKYYVILNLLSDQLVIE